MAETAAAPVATPQDQINQMLLMMGLMGLMKPPKYTGGPSDQENVLNLTSGGIKGGNLATPQTGYGLGAPMPPGAFQGMLRP